MSRNRVGAFVALLLLAGVLSCGREVIGPDGHRGPRGTIAFAPHFAHSVEQAPGDEAFAVTDLVVFTHVRVRILRQGVIIVDRTVAFPAASDSVQLSLSVPLLSTNPQGEELEATLKYYNSTTGDTVFSGGPLSITVRPGTNANPLPALVPLAYVGPGSQAVTVQLGPDSLLALNGQTVNLTATALDAQENVVGNAVVGFISRNPAKVFIANQGVGAAQVVGASGSTYVVAQLISGQRDSVKIAIDPRPSSMLQMSGNAQQTVQGTLFAQPLRVRITAADGTGVQGWPVLFKVTAGLGKIGSVGGPVDSLFVPTDTGGYAQVAWTAGDTAMAGSVTASIPTPALNVVFNGTQLSSAPSTLVFQTQPTNFTSGSTMSAPQVVVRNGAGATITSYTGPVRVQLTGGTVGAKLVGDTIVAAVAGIATFNNLTVDRGGANYRLIATAGAATPLQSNTFNVAPAPPAQRTLFSGGGQSAAASMPLADSIVVRITDMFGFPVPGVTVNFAVAQGGGSVSPTSGVTNVDGRVATQWTLGASGPQQITATAGALSPLAINATVIGGGPTVFFAGYDYTYLPSGQTRTVPVFLSSPSGSPITVGLSAQYDSIATFAVDSVTFAPGAMRIDVPITGGLPGESWAYFTSSAGDDSLFVFVDSAYVYLADIDYDQFTVGDTAVSLVFLSEPAPAGGVTVRVKSLNPALAQVTASDGEEVPLPGCVHPAMCFEADSRAEPSVVAVQGGDVNLLGALSDSVDLFIPEGHRVAHFAAVIVALGGDGGENVVFTATAPGYIGDAGSIYVDQFDLQALSAVSATSTPFGIGQNHELYIYYSGGPSVREQRITLSSDNPAVVTVDTSALIPRGESYSTKVGMRGVSAGTAWIRYGAPGAALDSFQVTVGTPKLSVSIDDPAPGEGETVYLRVYSAGPTTETFPRTAPLDVTVTSSDTTVAQIIGAVVQMRAGETQVSIPVRAVGTGSAWIVAQAPGHDPDSSFVVPAQQPLSYYNGLSLVGVGQYEELTIRIPTGFYLFGETKEATITAENSGIIDILTPTQQVGAEESFINIVYAGLAQGTDTIRVALPGHPDFLIEVAVNPTQLNLTTAFPSIDPDSVEFVAEAFVSDGIFAHPMMDTVYAVLRSSDPSVVQVTDSIMTIAAGAESALGKFRGLQPGSATLTLHVDGMDPSNGVNITVVPYQLHGNSASPVVGIGTREYAAIARNSSTSSTLSYSISQSGPGAVSFADLAETFEVGVTALNFSIAGVTPGLDTITFSAAGHAPLTMIISVDSVKLSLNDIANEVVAGFRDEFVYGYLRIGESSLPRRSNIQRKFVIKSLDTLHAVVEQDTVIFEPDDVYPTQFATVKYLDCCEAKLVVQDPLGVLAPDTVDVDIFPRELYGYTTLGDNQFVIGMGQRTDEWEVVVDRGYFSNDSLWVQLKASAPGLLIMPDSVLIEPGNYDVNVPIIAGDSVGAVRVEAWAPGYNPWQFDVTVTRTVIEPWFDDGLVGGQAAAEIYLTDALTGYSRPAAAPIPLQFSTTMPNLVNTGIGTFFADTANYYTMVLGPIGLSVGTTSVTVSDARSPSFASLVSGSSDFEIRQPMVELMREVYSVGLGLKSVSPAFAFNADVPQDSQWVRLSTSTARAKAAPDSVLVLRGSLEPEAMDALSFSTHEQFALIGDSLGVDTLTVSANGFQSDYAIISVEQGMLVLDNVPAPTIVDGDSTLVTLSLRDPAGGFAIAMQTLQINFSTGANFVVTDGTSSVTTMNIPISATTVSFWVKSVNVGSSDLVVSGPSFRPFKLRFTTRPIPG